MSGGVREYFHFQGSSCRKNGRRLASFKSADGGRVEKKLVVEISGGFGEGLSGADEGACGQQVKILLRSVHKQRVGDELGGIGHGQGGRPGAAGFVEPAVVAEGKRLRGCIGTDVDLSEVAGEVDQVVAELIVAAGQEAADGGFLEDAQDPVFGFEESVVPHPRPHAAHVRDGRPGTDEHIAEHVDIGSFEGIHNRVGQWRTEELQPRRAPDIDGPLVDIPEHIAPDEHEPAPALGLDTGGAGVVERAVLDRAPVAAHHIDPAARRAVGEGAVLDQERIESGEFEKVVIARSIDILKAAVAHGDVVCGRVIIAPIVDIDPIARLPAYEEAVEREVRAVYEVDSLRAALEHGPVQGFGLDDNRVLRRAVQVFEKLRAVAVDAIEHDDRIAGVDGVGVGGGGEGWEGAGGAYCDGLGEGGEGWEEEKWEEEALHNYYQFLIIN